MRTLLFLAIFFAGAFAQATEFYMRLRPSAEARLMADYFNHQKNLGNVLNSLETKLTPAGVKEFKRILSLNKASLTDSFPKAVAKGDTVTIGEAHIEFRANGKVYFNDEALPDVDPAQAAIEFRKLMKQNSNLQTNHRRVELLLPNAHAKGFLKGVLTTAVAVVVWKVVWNRATKLAAGGVITAKGVPYTAGEIYNNFWYSGTVQCNAEKKHYVRVSTKTGHDDIILTEEFLNLLAPFIEPAPAPGQSLTSSPCDEKSAGVLMAAMDKAKKEKAVEELDERGIREMEKRIKSDNRAPK